MGIEANKLIRKLDKNGDGKIGIEEFQEFFEKKAKQAAKFAATMKKKGVDSVDLLNDELVKKTVVITDAPAPAAAAAPVQVAAAAETSPPAVPQSPESPLSPRHMKDDQVEEELRM